MREGENTLTGAVNDDMLILSIKASMNGYFDLFLNFVLFYYSSIGII